MGVPDLNLDPMTAEEFFAFATARPDGEKWELIDGEPVLNAAPGFVHQRIVMNVLAGLSRIEASGRKHWQVLPGLAIRASETSLPIPDIVIRPEGYLASRECRDMIVAWEVLSPSTKDRDLKWKRTAYTALPTVTHYVVLAQDSVEVVIYARAAGFDEQRLRSLSASIDIPDLGISLPLAEIYRGTELDRQ